MISIEGVDGWLIPGDADYLMAAAGELPPHPMIMEIGSWMGLSATVFARAREDATIHCVDTWEGSPEHEGMVEPGELYETFRRNVASLGSRIVVYRMPSLQATATMCAAAFDLVFIDGLHTEAGALADMEACDRLLRPGAAMLIHDCLNDVQKAVRSFCRARGYGYEVTAPPAAHFIARLLR